jgi:hypothetical protein
MINFIQKQGGHRIAYFRAIQIVNQQLKLISQIKIKHLRIKMSFVCAL